MASEEFSLRCYCYLDRMQPQYAAFVGTVTQGDLPTEGMASLYIEMSPGNEVFRTVDIAVKATEAKPGAQIVEREFGFRCLDGDIHRKIGEHTSELQSPTNIV